MNTNIVFLLICAIFNIQHVENCDDESEVELRIHGGRFIRKNRPFMAAIYEKKSNDFLCGGSIIRKDWILTAAHCVDDYTYKDLYIRVGSNRTDRGGQVMNIITLITHPKYSKAKFEKDYAMIGVGQRLNLTANVAPIELPEDGFKFPSYGFAALVIGYGKVSNTASGQRNRLIQELAMNIMDLDTCKQIFTNPDRQVKDYMFCLGGDGRQSGCCYGDSGGPAVYDKTLIGVISWGKDCANQRYPTVVSRVDLEREWIEDIMDKYTYNFV